MGYGPYCLAMHRTGLTARNPAQYMDVGLYKQRSCTGNKQKSSKIMKMKMFVTLDKARPDTKYKRLKLGGGHVYGCSSV
jgi:hypothetical protein